MTKMTIDNTQTNSPEWQADIALTLETAKVCIAEQFPALLPITAIQLLGEGWDNKVFLVNQTILFRFPRRKIAAELIARENHILSCIGTYLKTPIKIPEFIYQGEPSTDFGYPFHGYKMLSGKSGCHANLKISERLASLDRLANFLKQLHQIDKTKAEKLGILHQRDNRLDVDKVIQLFDKAVGEIERHKIGVVDKTRYAKEIKQAKQIKLDEEAFCLIHGDLYCRHLLFDKTQNNTELTGIIDWGDAGIGHPAVDLSVIWSFYPQSAHQDFFAIYGEVDPKAWAYARFLALYSDCLILLYGIDVGDNLLVKESIESIKRIYPELIQFLSQ